MAYVMVSLLPKKILYFFVCQNHFVQHSTTDILMTLY